MKLIDTWNVAVITLLATLLLLLGLTGYHYYYGDEELRFRLLAPALSLGSMLIVIVGWLIVLENTRRVVRRNEASSLLSALFKSVEDAEKNGREFWSACPRTLDSKTRVEALMIQQYYENVALFFRMLVARSVLSEDSYSASLRAFHLALTMDCDNGDVLAARDISHRVHQVALNAREVKQTAHASFLQAFES